MRYARLYRGGRPPARICSICCAAFPSFAISSRSSLATYALVFCMLFSSTPRNSSRLAYRLLSLPKLEIEPFNHLLVSSDSCLRGELVPSLHALQTGRGSGIEFPRLSTQGLRSRPPDKARRTPNTASRKSLNLKGSNATARSIRVEEVEGVENVDATGRAGD